MLRTLYNADDRFKEVYWSRFEKQGWYLAGDGAVREERRESGEVAGVHQLAVAAQQVANLLICVGHDGQPAR